MKWKMSQKEIEIETEIKGESIFEKIEKKKYDYVIYMKEKLREIVKLNRTKCWGYIAYIYIYRQIVIEWFYNQSNLRQKNAR